MPTRREAIYRFLKASTVPELSGLYNPNMEVQVNVAQDNGERVEGEYRGRKWLGWTDGIETWKSFRIPYNANSEPTYTDSELKFNFENHVEAIGLTGWDWVNKVSKYVAFDFDAITGHSDKHSKKLTEHELKELQDAVRIVDWVTLRYSTSGNGLHLYVFLNDIPTSNHTEHASLARAILGKLSAITGFDFQSKVDICGSNIWIWHRKSLNNPKGFKLIKEGVPLEEAPVNWRDHIKVISGKSKKTVPVFLDDSETKEVTFDELCGQRPKVKLDDDHKKLIDFINESGAAWWWDQDRHMLVCHTYDLKTAHEELNLKGVFDTLATGKERGIDHNCFCFPKRRGAWEVRRYSPGTNEAPTWDQDPNGWTYCYYNREPNLRTVARKFGGVEDTTGGFVFNEAETAMKVASELGINFAVKPRYVGRSTQLKEHKDGRLVVEFNHESTDDGGDFQGWLQKGKKWKRILDGKINKTNEPEVGNYDDLLRQLITESDDFHSWVVKTDSRWITQPMTHAKVYLKAMGLSASEVDQVLGASVTKPWTIINRPFSEEFPGDRKWNKNAPQYRYLPSDYTGDLSYNTWNIILEHCGNGLDEAVINNSWCKSNGIIKGSEYLKCWIASLFQEPTEPLPYIFFYGPQNSGKSIFHEALELLITRGVVRADAALTSSSNFNGELENAVLCIVEETDLRSSNSSAYNRIKDWVTSRQLPIHKKMQTPYTVVNTTHWIQCSNEMEAVPVFPGDSRITMSYVGEIDVIIPKKLLIPRLQKEASDFLAEILNVELPESPDRLNVPVIETLDKVEAQKLNRTLLEQFLDEECYYVPGEMVLYSDLYDRFEEYVRFIDSKMLSHWTKQRMGKSLPKKFPKGRSTKSSSWFIGNMAFKPAESDKEPLILSNGKLV